MKRTKQGKNITVEFESIDDLSVYLRENIRPGSYTRQKPASDWCNWTYDEALVLLENGWIDGISQMDVMARQIEGQGEGEQVYVKYDVYGDFFNVGRFMSGEPECCGQFRKRKVKQGEVNVLVNVTAYGYAPAQILINRGAAIQALIDKLLETHYVNLQFIESARDCMGYDVTSTVNVDTRNHYSREAIAFLCGNPAYLRKIIFIVDEVETGNDDCMGHGCCKALTDEQLKGIDIYFPEINSSTEESKWETVESCKENVEKAVQKIAGNSENSENTGNTRYELPPPPKPAVSGVYGSR